MSKIKVLDNNMIDQIAAGEVVERPASVVKELVENALDAGATAVTVEIKEGGIAYIRVTDNGKGIPAGEMATAFLRHATSKIGTMEDLVNVRTLGFRGEALSSIASVAKVEAVTKTADAKLGRRIEIEGGEVISEKDTACPDGTSFIVRELFYNTPARRKFLKKPAAESSAIADILGRMALGRTDVAFKYINNGSTMLQTKGNNDEQAAVLAVYGADIAKKQINVKHEKDGFAVAGLVGRPEVARANRSYEHFYINGRYVKSDIVKRAAEDAYKTRIHVGRFPFFILRLTAAPDFVDVNVHPTKMEVRFSDENKVYELIYAAVDKALKGENLIPRKDAAEISKAFFMPQSTEDRQGVNIEKWLQNDIDVSEIGRSGEPEIEEAPEPNRGNSFSASRKGIFVAETAAVPYKADDATADMPAVTYIKMPPPEPVEEIEIHDTERLTEGPPKLFNTANKSEPEIKEIPLEPKPEPFFKHYRIVGQVFATYWIIEQGTSMYMIDQHAAHERLLYDEFSDKFRRGEVVSQNLLTPIAISLTEKEMLTVRDNIELFNRFGFVLEELGERVYALRAVPYIFKNPENGAFFMEILDTLADEGAHQLGTPYERRLDSIATMACKAAVKGHDLLAYSEAKSLIERILRLENPFTCPHGRPTIVELSNYQIEKMFQRKM